jgi:hypothetical protein
MSSISQSLPTKLANRHSAGADLPATKRAKTSDLSAAKRTKTNKKRRPLDDKDDYGPGGDDKYDDGDDVLAVADALQGNGVVLA